MTVANLVFSNKLTGKSSTYDCLFHTVFSELARVQKNWILLRSRPLSGPVNLQICRVSPFLPFPVSSPLPPKAVQICRGIPRQAGGLISRGGGAQQSKV